MASFATDRGTIRPHLAHLLVKLALMRVLVTGGTGAIVEMVKDRILGFRGGSLFMTVAAGNCDVAAGENEARLLVALNGVGRRLPTVQGVALFANVLIGGTGKLRLMFVFVTGHAAVELQLVDGLFTFRNVAPRTFHLGVLGFQWVSRGGVIFDRVLRWFKSV